MFVAPLPDNVARRLPRPTLAPLRHRLDTVGIVEHARGSVPSAAFGHCTDDAGRALGLATQLQADPDANTVASSCLRQLDRSLGSDGRFVTRLDEHGQPTDDAPSDDASARALWGLALAAVNPWHGAVSRAATWTLERVAPFESDHPRAAAHAVIAGTELLSSDGTSAIGRHLVEVNLPRIPRTPTSTAWPWPERRLTYGNALLIEAVLAASQICGDEDMTIEAVELLEWLVLLEWNVDGHFSFTPTSGRTVGDGTGFDQQPIEAWTLANACRRALDITGDTKWLDAIGWAAAWFDGKNDVGTPVWDPTTGAAFDGLTATGPNLNQGTESTLAFIGTMHAYREALDTTSIGQRPRSASR